MNSSLQDYEVLNIVGSGSFGTCYKVRNTLTQEINVWKAVDYGKMSEERKKMLCNEVNVLSEISHPFIVKFLSKIIHKETTTVYIIMEWCKGGDLSEVIKETHKGGKLVEEWYVWRVLYQLCRALEHLHVVHTIVHRDVKSSNVFLDVRGNVKLGDFGLSCLLGHSNTPQTITGGTLNYLSPETLKGGRYTFKSDIWSLGCLVYEVCALSPPFNDVSTAQLMNNIKIGRFQRIPANYSDSLCNIINLMLTVPIDLRPSAKIISHHPAVVANQTNGSANIQISSKKSSVPVDMEHLGKWLGEVKISDGEPQDVSKRIYKDKWLAKLESVRNREARLRDKAEMLEKREHSLNRREKQLTILERQAREKMARARVYLNQCKDSKQSFPPAALRDRSNLNETDASYSADPGDTSILPTVAKLDHLSLPKPNFPDFPKTTKHVHFHHEAPGALQTNSSAELSYFQLSQTSGNQQQTMVKGLKFREFLRPGKENKSASEHFRRKSVSRLSVRSSHVFV